jgi:outer membrane receptor protein involved in Fe transport
VIKRDTLRNRLKASSALHALALIGAGLAQSVVFAPMAAAQDYTTGAVSGTVVDAKNKPIANAQVTLRSQAQNQARTLTTSRGGTFSAAGLVAGTYDVAITSSGFESYADTITIVAAQENRLTLTLSRTGSNDIVVTGARVRQDFTKTTTGLNIDVVDIAKNAPVGRSLGALIQLAPGTVQGAAGFGTGNNTVESIGGSSVAENAYYINGLNITNPNTYVGGSRVPFDFYQTVDVQTGGYAAEFGRATGGVINATTKSGSNAPMMAIHGNFEPGVQSHSPNVGDPTDPDTIGRLGRNFNDSLTFEASGALIKDHVFLYGLFQPQSLITEGAYPTSGYYERTKSTTPFYGGKADVYFTSTQHLEFTLFNTAETIQRDRFAITPNANFTDATIGQSVGKEVQTTGGLNWVGRYTGSITNWFQISGAYGISKDSNIVGPGDTGSYFVNDRRTSTVGGNSTTISSQTFLTGDSERTKRKFYRVDGDLRFSIAGEHHVRFGMDNEDLSMNHVTQINGGLPLEYSYRDGGTVLTYERLGGAVSGRDRAFYLQDSWQPLTGLTINAGVRDDEFNQKNLSGQKYLDFKGNFAARAGFSYTPNGSSNFQFFGNYGRYFIPPAMNLGFRGKDDYFQEYFAYPAGITAATFPTDPNTGLPLINLGPARTNVSGFSSACPNDLSSAPGNPVNGTNTCNVFGSNLQDPAGAKVAPNAKATYEDEFILGTRFRPTPLLSIGLTATYRRLSRVSEDTDFSQQLLDYYGCGSTSQTGTVAQCDRYALRNTYYIWNPGSSSVTLNDWVDPSKKVTLTGLPFPKPKRTYEALVLDWRRVDDGKYYVQGSFTLSKSKGNYEGTVSSDIGNGVQTDAGSGIGFDYPGLSQNNYGLLPNDHRFVFKLAGGYHFTNNLVIGTNVQVQSPMHGSCQGYDPYDSDAYGYGSVAYFCGTGALDANGNYDQTAAAPRGTGWTTDWLTQFDLSVHYTLPESLGLAKGLTLRVDVFNIFNSAAVLNRNPEHEIDSATNDGTNGTVAGTTYFTRNPAYETPTAFQQPRYFRFGFDWQF